MRADVDLPPDIARAPSIVPPDRPAREAVPARDDAESQRPRPLTAVGRDIEPARPGFRETSVGEMWLPALFAAVKNLSRPVLLIAAVVAHIVVVPVVAAVAFCWHRLRGTSATDGDAR